jgi:hypothetical protein
VAVATFHRKFPVVIQDVQDFPVVFRDFPVVIQDFQDFPVVFRDFPVVIQDFPVVNLNHKNSAHTLKMLLSVEEAFDGIICQHEGSPRIGVERLLLLHRTSACKFSCCLLFFFFFFSLFFSKGWQGRLREVFTLATCPECLREVFTQGSFISLFFFFSLKDNRGAPKRFSLLLPALGASERFSPKDLYYYFFFFFFLFRVCPKWGQNPSL